MKKGQMIPALLMAALLTGCAGQDGNTQAESTQAENAQTEYTVQASGENPVLAENLIQTENRALSGDSVQPEEESAAADMTQDLTEHTGNEEASDDGIMLQEQEQIGGFGDVATMNNHVGGRELPIYCVDTEEKKVALSFDAAWGNEDTAEILSILQKHDIHATFFMTGGWVESYPDDVAAILAAGHDLGNHSENHKNMSELSDEEKTEELMAVHQKVKEVTGYDMFLFRPPYGDYDNAVIDVAKDCEYYAIQWSIDSLDWKDYGADDIVKRVVKSDKLDNGAIILMHNGAEYTADALEAVITGLQDKGYELVPVSQLIYKDKYHMRADGTQVSEQ